MTRCPRCGAGHNILLCPTAETERAFVLKENMDNSDWTENEEALANPDKCYLIRRSKDSETKNEKKNPMDGVKTALRDLSSEQKTNKTPSDRAAFVQVGRFDQIRLLQESLCLEKSGDSDTISDKNKDTESEAEFKTATES